MAHWELIIRIKFYGIKPPTDSQLIVLSLKFLCTNFLPLAELEVQLAQVFQKRKQGGMANTVTTHAVTQFINTYDDA